MLLKVGMFSQQKFLVNSNPYKIPSKSPQKNYQTNSKLIFEKRHSDWRSSRIIKSAQTYEVNQNQTQLHQFQPAKINDHNQFQTKSQQRKFLASISINQELAAQRLQEMRGYVERWVNVAGFFAPFCLLVLGAFVLIKSIFGFTGVVEEYYEGQKVGKDVKTMIAEDKDKLRFQRESKFSGTTTKETVEKMEDELFSKDYLINDLKKQQQQVVSKPKQLEEEEQELKKLDPTQDFLQSAISTDGIKVVSDQQIQIPGFPLIPPSEEQTAKKPPQQQQQIQVEQAQTEKPEKSEKMPDKVFAFQGAQEVSEKQAAGEVGRPWWHDLERFSIVQFKLREDDQTMPLYIDANFEQEQDLQQDREPQITIIAFESFEEAVDFYKYMVPRWKFDAEQGGEYPMWQEVEKMDIQQLQPMQFLEEIEYLGYRLEVIPKGQIKFTGDMTYADFYERVLTVCKIPGWEEAVMQHAEWEDFDNDLEAATKRQKEDVQYTGPGSLEGAKGFTVL